MEHRLVDFARRSMWKSMAYRQMMHSIYCPPLFPLCDDAHKVMRALTAEQNKENSPLRVHRGNPLRRSSRAVISERSSHSLSPACFPACRLALQIRVRPTGIETPRGKEVMEKIQVRQVSQNVDPRCSHLVRFGSSVRQERISTHNNAFQSHLISLPAPP